MSSASSVDQEGWKAICVKFYLNGDATARNALSAFERGQETSKVGATLVQRSEHVAVAVDSETTPEATELLASVGLASLASLNAGALLACIATKNAARSETHALVGFLFSLPRSTNDQSSN